jgi:hypothetical protein
MTDLGSLHQFLDIQVRRDSNGLVLSQRQYIPDLLTRTGMSDCQLCHTPVDTGSNLFDAGDSFSDPTLYRSITDALQYLTHTRHDISFAVQ